jgi:uncharacterized protein YdhG (YjbR/CyaY superfamily)
MDSDRAAVASIDRYIAAFPAETRRLLKELRAAIRAAAPGAEEKISYGMPTFALKGNLVHFAAFKNHIGFFGASGAVRAFKDELSGYATEKGALKLPLDQPLPLEMIRKIVKFRVAENLKRAELKAGKKK